jgi:probable phosphoglycerate mutase
VRRLVLLRHGVTAWNAERRFQGHADIELTEAGHLQAKAAAEALASYDPAALWTSDLARAARTAEHVAERTRLRPEVDERLREVHVGDFQGRTWDEARARAGEGPWDYGRYGGESDAALAERFTAACTDLAATLAEDQTAVVVSHGHALRVGTAALLGWPQLAGSLGALGNCGWVEVVESGPRGSWRLAAYNRMTPIS